MSKSDGERERGGELGEREEGELASTRLNKSVKECNKSVRKKKRNQKNDSADNGRNKAPGV